jgi:hypothetical protein
MRAFRTPFVDKLKLPVWAAFFIQETASFPPSLSRRFFRGVNDETEYFPIYNQEFICFSFYLAIRLVSFLQSGHINSQNYSNKQ